MTHKTFDLGDVLLDSGQTLRNGQLAFQTYGTLSPAGDNVVVMPTFFTGSHQRNEGFSAPDGPLIPRFISLCRST